jgi:tRNA (mo5U34)-methyltransferase
VTPTQIRDAAAGIRWFHSIDLGHGITTPGESNNHGTLKRLGLPPSLRGMTVLDIGAWDGFFSFEAERRGARRVLATDHYCWSGPGWGTKAGFDLARRALGSKVEDLDIDVLDLSPERVGVFDVVLLLGVLYHLRHPLLALEKVHSVTGRQLILETHVDMLHCFRPACAFYPADELDRDPTNWFGPNPAAVAAMLRDVGFRRVEVVQAPRWLPRRLAREARQMLRGRRNGLIRALNQERLVVHAWR